jgi:peptidoglycan/LPS O-acetylase OafA/YrhL
MLFHFRNFTPTNSRPQLEEAVNHFPANDFLRFLYISGDFAVPMFWAISGVTIAFTYEKSNTSFKKFLVSRFARLYPLHILTLFVVVTLQIYAQNQYNSYLIYDGNNLTNFLLHIFFLSGFATSNAQGFNAPIWSVSVEMLTYIIYAVFSIKFKVTTLHFAIFNLVLTQFIFLFAGRHSAFLCLSYFSLGIIGYEMRKLRPRRIIILITFLVITNEITGRPSALAISAVLIVLSNISIGSWLRKYNKKLPNLRIKNITEFLGNLTYGIYLWHIPVQMLLMIVIRNAEIKMNDDSLLILLLAWILITLLASSFTFRYFEIYCKRKILKFSIMDSNLSKTPNDPNHR